MIVNKSDRLIGSRALLNNFTDLGVRRQQFLTTLEEARKSKNSSFYVATVPYGTAKYRLFSQITSPLSDNPTDAEQAAADKQKSDDEIDVQTRGISRQFVSGVRGAVFGNKKIGDLIIPCGTVLIVAGGGLGKTPIAQALAFEGVESASIVPAGEPFAGYEHRHWRVAEEMGLDMLQTSDIVLDSIKDVLGVGEALTQGGISRTAISMLSQWSTLAIELGCTLYIPVNPSNTKAEVVESLVEAARSNGTCVLTPGSNEGRWNYESRTGEGLARVKGHIDFIFSQDGSSASVSSTSNNSGSLTKVGPQNQRPENGLTASVAIPDYESLHSRFVTRG